MDLEKNCLIQEIRHNKMASRFWQILMISVVIGLGVMRVFHDFNISFSSTLAWIFLATYIVVILIFLAIYRLMVNVSEKEIIDLANEKISRCLEENEQDQEQIDFYEKAIERLKEKQDVRNETINKLRQFL